MLAPMSACRAVLLCLGLASAMGCDDRQPPPVAPTPAPDLAPPPSRAVPAASASALPSAARLSAGTVTCSTSAGQLTTISDPQVRALFATAREVDTSQPDGWQYSPWCTGSVKLDGREKPLVLFLGGRGALTTDNGRVLFDFDARAFELSFATDAGAPPRPARASNAQLRAMLVPAHQPGIVVCEAPFVHGYTLAPNADPRRFMEAVGMLGVADASAGEPPCYAPGPHLSFNAANWCCVF